MQSPDLRPFGRDGPNGAGDELDLDAHLIQLRQQNVQFAEPHKRLAANYREVERAATANQCQQPVDQLLAFVIGQRAQRPELPEVFWLVSVTPRAAQRALAGDLDRQHRMMSTQNAAPAAKYISFFHTALEDRGLRIEDRLIVHEAILDPRSSILDPRSSLPSLFTKIIGALDH